MKKLAIVLAGLIISGFLGGFFGLLAWTAWYELVEVPKTASMNPSDAASYLCAAGRYDPFLMAALGVIVGGSVGLLVSVLKVNYQPR